MVEDRTGFQRPPSYTDPSLSRMPGYPGVSSPGDPPDAAGCPRCHGCKLRGMYWDVVLDGCCDHTPRSLVQAETVILGLIAQVQHLSATLEAVRNKHALGNALVVNQAREAVSAARRLLREYTFEEAP